MNEAPTKRRLRAGQAEKSVKRSAGGSAGSRKQREQTHKLNDTPPHPGNLDTLKTESSRGTPPPTGESQPGVAATPRKNLARARFRAARTAEIDDGLRAWARIARGGATALATIATTKLLQQGHSPYAIWQAPLVESRGELSKTSILINRTRIAASLQRRVTGQPGWSIFIRSPIHPSVRPSTHPPSLSIKLGDSSCLSEELT